MKLPNWPEVQKDCVEFTRRLIRTPSLSGNESEIAGLVAEELQRLNFDRVWIDEMGNVGGMVDGEGHSEGAIVLNSHLDHVDPGELSLWPYPPYKAVFEGDRIYGRGACDIKGPLAVQVYGIAAMLMAGTRPRRDVYFSAVVQEETGGGGAKYWADNLDIPVDLILLAEPTSNNLSQGHRGILQIWVRFDGMSVHASVPERGHNPNFALAEFLSQLSAEVSSLKPHPVLGPTSVAPTIIEVDTTSPNVTPAWTRVLLDVRSATESPNSLRAMVERLIGNWPHFISNAWSDTADRPMQKSDMALSGFYTPDGSTVGRVRSLIADGMGWQPELTKYEFATDGRFFVHLDVPILGYSPGEERLAHTVDESISVSMMLDGLKGHFNLLRSF